MASSIGLVACPAMAWRNSFSAAANSSCGGVNPGRRKRARRARPALLIETPVFGRSANLYLHDADAIFPRRIACLPTVQKRSLSPLKKGPVHGDGPSILRRPLRGRVIYSLQPANRASLLGAAVPSLAALTASVTVSFATSPVRLNSANPPR